MTPTLLFDGACGFCTAAVEFLERYVRPRADVVPWQRVNLAELGVTAEECAMSVQWITAPGDPVLAEGRAVAAVLRSGREPWRTAGLLMALPGISQVADAVYRVIAANRRYLPGVTPALASAEYLSSNREPPSGVEQ